MEDKRKIVDRMDGREREKQENLNNAGIFINPYFYIHLMKSQLFTCQKPEEKEKRIE